MYNHVVIHIGTFPRWSKKDVLSLEDDYKYFVTDFKQVIDHEDVKEADDDHRNDIGIEDPYLNM